MKKIFLLVVAFLTLGVWAQEPNVEFESKNFDFGTIEEADGVLTHVFTFTNKSATPFVIVGVTTSCGCTTSEYTVEPVLKGKTGEVTVKFDPADRPGRNAKTIRVMSNQGEVALRIFGIVNPRERTLEELYPFAIGGGARLDRVSTSMTEVPVGGYNDVEIGIANSNESKAVTVDVESLSKNISLLGGAVTIKPRENKTVKLRVRGNDYGSFTHAVKFKVDGVSRSETIMIAGVVVTSVDALSEEEMMVQPYAKFSSRYMNLGAVEAMKTIEKEVVITNNGRGELKILKLELPETITADIETKTIPIGGSAVLKLHYKPTLSGYDSSVARIFLNDPHLPMTEIRILSEVR